MKIKCHSVQFSSVAQSCLTLCDPRDCSTPGFPVHHQLPKFTQTDVHWVGDAIQPSHPLLPPSPPAFNLSQHQGLFKWVSSSHQVAKVLEFQLQHQSFQWIFRLISFSIDWLNHSILSVSRHCQRSPGGKNHRAPSPRPPSWEPLLKSNLTQELMSVRSNKNIRPWILQVLVAF